MMGRIRNVRYIIYLFLALGSIILVICKLNTIQSRSAYNKEEGRVAGKKSDTDLLPTDTPAISFNDAVLCKMEFDGFKKMSEKTGASGMFFIDRSSLELGVCQFDVMKIAPSRGKGTIRMMNDPEGKDYGIKLSFDGSDEKQLFDWSKTALMFFNKDIDEQTAEKAVQTAINEGSTESDLYKIRSYNDFDSNRVTTLKIIEIRTP